MPVLGIIGAVIGAEVLGATLGTVVASAIGGAIGGGIGAEISGGNFADGFISGGIGGALGGWMGAGATQAEMLAAQEAGFSGADLAAWGGTTSQAPIIEAVSQGAQNLGNIVEGAGDFTGASVDGLQGMYSNMQDLTRGGLESVGTDINTTFANNLPWESAINEPGLLETGNFTPNDGIGVTQLDQITATPTFTPGGGVPTSGLEGVTSATQASPILPNTTYSGSLKNMFSKYMPKNVSPIEMGMAATQTISDYMDANTLEKRAREANKPYETLMDTINNPGKYADTYMQGEGGLDAQRAARQFAKSGRTGMLPTLFNQGKMNYMAKGLPNMQQGLASAGQMANNNLANQTYAMKMKQNAFGHIPSVYTTSKMGEIFKNYGVKNG